MLSPATKTIIPRDELLPMLQTGSNDTSSKELFNNFQVRVIIATSVVPNPLLLPAMHA